MTQSGYLVPSPRTESSFLDEKENSELLGFRILTIFRPVSILRFLEYRTMDKVRKPSNSDCYTPSSERFSIYAKEGIVNYSYPVSSFPFLSFRPCPFYPTSLICKYKNELMSSPYCLCIHLSVHLTVCLSPPNFYDHEACVISLSYVCLCSLN
jgi:hypothetical protein